MNVLVTGGAGYVGSVLTQILLESGHDVVVLDSLMYGRDGLRELEGRAGFRFVQGDTRSAASVRDALLGVHAVVHLAAIVGDPACARQPRLAQEVNRDASLQLFDLSRRQGVTRFVFASTCSNYGKMRDASEYVTEDAELQPLSLYAQTKVDVEHAILGGQPPPAVTVLRFATIFGLSPRMRFDLTVNEFTSELLTKRKLVVFGERFWRPYVHVRDAARAVALVLDAPPDKVQGQAFNVGSTDQNYQKQQLVELVRARIREAVEIRYVQKHEDPRDYRVSFEKIRRELGFNVTMSVEDGIEEVKAFVSSTAVDLGQPCYHN